MSELKLRRVIEHNQRLREDLARPRVRVSEASARCVCVPYAVDSVPGGARLGRAELTTRDAASSGTARRRKTTWCPQCGARSGARRTRTAHRPRGANAPSSDRARSFTSPRTRSSRLAWPGLTLLSLLAPTLAVPTRIPCLVSYSYHYVCYRIVWGVYYLWMDGWTCFECDKKLWFALVLEDSRKLNCIGT
jgi:hypothetical protein